MSAGPLAVRIWQAAPMLELLPEAALASDEAEARAADERCGYDHLCLLCGAQAEAAIVLRLRGGAYREPRWADLCARCREALREESGCG